MSPVRAAAAFMLGITMAGFVQASADSDKASAHIFPIGFYYAGGNLPAAERAADYAAMRKAGFNAVVINAVHEQFADDLQKASAHRLAVLAELAGELPDALKLVKQHYHNPHLMGWNIVGYADNPNRDGAWFKDRVEALRGIDSVDGVYANIANIDKLRPEAAQQGLSYMIESPMGMPADGEITRRLDEARTRKSFDEAGLWIKLHSGPSGLNPPPDFQLTTARVFEAMVAGAGGVYFSCFRDGTAHWKISEAPGWSFYAGIAETIEKYRRFFELFGNTRLDTGVGEVTAAVWSANRYAERLLIIVNTKNTPSAPIALAVEGAAQFKRAAAFPPQQTMLKQDEKFSGTLAPFAVQIWLAPAQAEEN